MDQLFERLWERKYVFFATFFVVYTLVYTAFVAFDFLPEPPAEAVAPEAETEMQVTPVVEPVIILPEATSTEPIVGETVAVSESPSQYEAVSEIELDPNGVSVSAEVLPVLLSIPKLGKTVTVLNPTSRAVADLDAALLEGVVRHPDSAVLNQEGTVFILGHSSYLPQVFNKNFQAFNGIQSLEWGDLIEVSSTDEVYEYRVEKVYRAKAQDASVPIAGSTKQLILATCNSFGDVNDRFVVEARQVSVKER